MISDKHTHYVLVANSVQHVFLGASTVGSRKIQDIG